MWDLYCRLDGEQKQAMRAAVTVYLSTSSNIVETGRALSLLRQTPVDQWDDDLQAAGVLLHLRAGNKPAAIEQLTTGLTLRLSRAGLEILLQDALQNKDWPALLKIWLGYHSILGPKTDSIPEPQINERYWTANIPDLANLYFAFERYLEAETVEPVRAINLYADTRLGLEALRRWLAEQALRQPCSPRQARAILRIWNNQGLFQQYLDRMLRRWKEGSETRAGLAILSDIYSDYGKLDDTKTPVSLLQKLFEFYYPANAAGLTQVYRDWHQAWGDLDQWGYEKFLKFYSATGDVQAVKDLWARYTQKFPNVLTMPMGFRSTLNLYAQIGDVAGAEQEFRTMTDKYGIRPDIDSWNSLLKCYTKTDDQARAVECFEQIQKVSHPDSFTYAQVMAMAAKRGDMPTVLGYFDQAQRQGVLLSKEMALSLVMVCCHNDRLVDAERICAEFSERNTTSTLVWNQLIYFYGLKGNLDKCQELLMTMKKYGLEWDNQTHEFLLQAMVHVDQIQPAYRLLQKARENGMFPVGPEHFAVVMSGAVRAGQLSLAEAVMTQMRWLGLAVPFKAHVSYVEAAVRRSPSAERTEALAKDLVDHLLAMLPSQRPRQAASGADPPAWTAPGGLVELKKQTKHVGRAVFLLVELRAFQTVEQLVTAYMEAFPEYKERNTLPPEIASALMLGYLKDGRFDRVREMWEQAVDAALATCASPEGTIYPAHQYELARPLNVVAKAFRETNDGRGLLAAVEQVTSAGFRLTNTNWNLAIRYLTEMGLWEPAMEWCEEKLMPRWGGWAPATESPEERRDLKNTRVLKASKATVLGLQRQWLKLRKLAAWSADVSAKLLDIEQRHPALHQAFTTTDYELLPAALVSPKRRSMTKAIRDMLKPLSHDELRATKKALQRQLRVERRGKTGAPSSRTAARRESRQTLRAKGSPNEEALPEKKPATEAQDTAGQTSQPAYRVKDSRNEEAGPEKKPATEAQDTAGRKSQQLAQLAENSRNEKTILERKLAAKARRAANREKRRPLQDEDLETVKMILKRKLAGAGDMSKRAGDGGERIRNGDNTGGGGQAPGHPGGT